MFQSHKHHPLEYQSGRINSVLNCTKKDLAANREGYLSDRQVKLVQKAMRWSIFQTVLLVGLVSIVAAAGFYTQFSDKTLIPFSFYFVLIAVVLFWVKDDLQQSQLENIDRTVFALPLKDLRIVSRGSRTSPFIMSIHGMQFQTRRSVYEMLRADLPSVVYVAEANNQIVGAE